MPIKLAVQYFKWHYSRGVVDLYHNILNFVWFFYNFFSIPLLVQTLFVPFKRLSEPTQNTFDLEEKMENFVVNTLMRIVGFLMRSFLIILGTIFILLTMVVGIVILLIWILVPLLLLWLMTTALVTLFVA